MNDVVSNADDDPHETALSSTLWSRLDEHDLDWIVPDWPAPSRVCAVMTTRNADHDAGVRRSMNLGRATEAVVVEVERNRALLAKVVGVDSLWLSQTHGIGVANADTAPQLVGADAAVARMPGRAAAVRVADCMPVLFSSVDGDVVAAAHAGWRGLNAGVLEATVREMRVPTRDVIAWLGPAIGPRAFEVGDDVRAAFCKNDDDASGAFMPYLGRPGKWLADLYALARMRLRRAGVESIHGGGECTYTDALRFFSYRRDGSMERMAALIWIDDASP